MLRMLLISILGVSLARPAMAGEVVAEAEVKIPLAAATAGLALPLEQGGLVVVAPDGPFAKTLAVRRFDAQLGEVWAKGIELPKPRVDAKVVVGLGGMGLGPDFELVGGGTTFASIEEVGGSVRLLASVVSAVGMSTFDLDTGDTAHRLLVDEVPRGGTAMLVVGDHTKRFAVFALADDKKSAEAWFFERDGSPRGQSSFAVDKLHRGTGDGLHSVYLDAEGHLLTVTRTDEKTVRVDRHAPELEPASWSVQTPYPELEWTCLAVHADGSATLVAATSEGGRFTEGLLLAALDPEAGKVRYATVHATGELFARVGKKDTKNLVMVAHRGHSEGGLTLAFQPMRGPGITPGGQADRTPMLFVTRLPEDGVRMGDAQLLGFDADGGLAFHLVASVEQAMTAQLAWVTDGIQLWDDGGNFQLLHRQGSFLSNEIRLTSVAAGGAVQDEVLADFKAKEQFMRRLSVRLADGSIVLVLHKGGALSTKSRLVKIVPDAD